MDLGSFSDQTDSFASTGSPIQDNLTKTQAMHALPFPLELPGRLPENLRGTSPSFALSKGGYATFTFSFAKTHAFLVKIGHGNVQIPVNLDGATFHMGRPNGIQVNYQKDRNTLILSEGAIYNVQATGKASVKNLDDFMLLLPNLSPLVKAELTQNNGDELEPYPIGTKITPVTIHHVTGFLVSDKNDPTITWQENGIQYSLHGSNLTADQFLAIANSMH